MKSQGLPINFIVIAALAILILVLAAAFVITGGASLGATLAPDAAKASCNRFCTTSRESAMNTFGYDDAELWKTLAPIEQRFCTARMDVQGVGLNVTCEQLVGTCVITFPDGTTWAMNCDSPAGTGFQD